jgi:hypothetical protein
MCYHYRVGRAIKNAWAHLETLVAWYYVPKEFVFRLYAMADVLGLQGKQGVGRGFSTIISGNKLWWRSHTAYSQIGKGNGSEDNVHARRESWLRAVHGRGHCGMQAKVVVVAGELSKVGF